MREAKNVATILGTIAVCLISGLMVADKAAPNVNSSNMVEIEEPASEEMTVAAIQTSVSTTTAIVTTTAATTTIELTTTTTAPAETTTTTTTAPEIVTEAVQENTPEELPPEPAAEPEAPAEAPAPEEPAEEITETETPTEPETEPETQPETQADERIQELVLDEEDSLPISDEDFVVLCNVVAHEAGSNWISENDKAKVVEVIMNRVHSDLFPNTITDVLTQPGQFTGSETYAFNGSFMPYVTEAVQNAVRLYFNQPEAFEDGYLYFWGDGIQNHFR